MRRVFLLLSIAAIEGALIACTVSANVGDLSATSAEAGSDSGTLDGPLGDAPAGDTSSSDSSSPPIDAGCGVDFPQEAMFIDAVTQLQSGPPQPVGGTIVAGTYVLTGMNVYFTGTAGTVQVRETMHVRGGGPAGAFDRLTEAKNPTGPLKAEALHGETITWSAPSGPALFVTPECPKKSPESSGAYSVSGDTLTVEEDGQTTVVRTYRRLR